MREDTAEHLMCGVKRNLFDHLVGDGKQPRREAEVECIGGVEIYHELLPPWVAGHCQIPATDGITAWGCDEVGEFTRVARSSVGSIAVAARHLCHSRGGSALIPFFTVLWGIACCCVAHQAL